MEDGRGKGRERKRGGGWREEGGRRGGGGRMRVSLKLCLRKLRFA